MEIHDYIDRLSKVSAIVANISAEASINARVYLCGEYWSFRCYDSNGDSCYSKDFETLNELADHLDGIMVGINLANGKEI